MNRRTTLAMTILSILFFAASALAEVSIETSVSRSRLAVGDELTLDIIISNANGPISQPKLPPIDGFSSYSQGHSQAISITNGRSSSQSIYSYVLIANSIGKKTIGPFEVEIGGKVYKVAAVEVEVTSDNPSQGFSQNTAFSQSPVVAPPPRAMPGDGISNQDIFVKTWLDKDEAFMNEPVMLTYTIYTRLSATYKGFEKEPVTTGFWVEDFPPDKTIRKTEQIFNGSRYVVADVRKMALFPTEPGVFTIDPGTVGTTVEVRNDDNFNSFFSYNIFGRRGPYAQSPFFSQILTKVIPTEKVTVVAKALPETGKPANFSGAAGDYQIESSIDRREVEAGSPITYKVRIFGEGNINTLQTPSIPKIENFKVYDSSSSVNISKNRLVVEGEKVTETVLVPKKAGIYTIPALEFSYFDYKAKAYRTIKTSAHRLDVKPGAEPEEAPASPGVQPVDQEEVWITGKDIRYIKTFEDPRATAARPLYKNPIYWMINFLFLAVSFVLLFLASTRANTLRDRKGSRARGSHRIAKARLKKASHLMKREKSEAFFSELSRAIYGYFADKLDVSVQSVSLELIERSLPQDAPPEIFNQIRVLLDELSMGRFSRLEKGDEEIKRIYDMADQVITRFEKVKLR